MFRSVALPAPIPGRLYLHSMPGRREPLEAAIAALREREIGCVVCLAPTAELARKSPEYAAAIDALTLAERARVPSLEWDHLPIDDLGAPADTAAFWAVAQSTASRLRSGEHVLIHCAAGVGRTGTLAICVLLALGVPLDAARDLVRAAGAGPEVEAQERLVAGARAPS
jgi:hypothetical protein